MFSGRPLLRRLLLQLWGMPGLRTNWRQLRELRRSRPATERGVLQRHVRSQHAALYL